MMRSTAFQTLALSVLITSGCQAALPLHAMRQPIFALGQQDQAMDVAVATRPTTDAGALIVSFQGELAQWTRRVLATVADVEKVVVSVKPTGAAEISQTVLKTAITNGQTSVSFQGLPPGDASITITAFDMLDTNIGSVTKTAVVAAGQTTTLDVALQLTPTISTGTDGGTTPTTGGLNTNISIINGPLLYPNAAPGAVAGEFPLDFMPKDVEVDAAGNAWVGGVRNATPSQGVLVKLAPDGTELKRVNLGTAVLELDLTEDGHIWAISDRLYELDEQGNVLRQFSDISIPTGLENLAADAAGNVWLSTPDAHTYRLNVDGTCSINPGTGTNVIFGAQQDAWVTGIYSSFFGVPMEEAHYVVRYSKAGTEIGRYSLGAGYNSAYAAVDPTGNVWVTGRANEPTSGLKGRLAKFSPDGQTLGLYNVSGGFAANAVAVGAGGVVWVFNSDIDHTFVSRFSSSGVELGSVELVGVEPYMDVNQWNLAAGSSGAWVMLETSKKVLRLAP